MVTRVCSYLQPRHCGLALESKPQIKVPILLYSWLPLSGVTSPYTVRNQWNPVQKELNTHCVQIVQWLSGNALFWLFSITVSFQSATVVNAHLLKNKWDSRNCFMNFCFFKCRAPYLAGRCSHIQHLMHSLLDLLLIREVSAPFSEQTILHAFSSAHWLMEPTAKFQQV